MRSDIRVPLLVLAIPVLSLEAEAQLSELPFGNPEVPAGDGPRRLALGDLDGDGDRDVVTALAGTIDPITGFADGTTTGVLLANGDGTFESPFELPAGLGPREVAVVDLDGDGHLDVVSMQREVGTVTVQRNLGDGRTFAGKSFDAGVDCRGMDVGDVDADGDLDVVVGHLAGVASPETGVTVLANDGSGRLAPSTEVATLGQPRAVALGDLDGDGDLDVATAEFSFTLQQVTLLENDGGGAFTTLTTLPASTPPFGGPTNVRIVDLTGDGVTDLAVVVSETVCCDGALWLFAGLGGGAFAPPEMFTVGKSPEAITVEDVDGDGDLDVGIANDIVGDSVSLLLGDGAGDFAEAQTIHVGKSPLGLAFEDVDGDGALDLLTTHSAGDTLGVTRGLGGADFADEVGIAPGVDADGAGFADADGDGLADLIVVGEQGVAFLRRGADGAFEDPVLSDLEVAFPKMATAVDLDGDGTADVAAVDDDTLEVRFNAGDGTFGAFTTTALPVGGARAVAAADLDDDGDADLAVVHFEDANPFGPSATLVRIFSNQGDGTLVETATVPFSMSTVTDDATSDFDHFVGAFHDLDGDGREDLLVVPNDGVGFLPDDRLLVFEGLEGGALAPPEQIALPAGSRGLAVADVNHDGNLDAAVAVTAGQVGSAGGSTVAVLLGDGRGGFRPFREFAADDGPGSVAFGDVDRDGNLDLMTVTDEGLLVVLSGDGAGGFERTGAFGGGTFGHFAFPHDLDHDGALDLVAVNHVNFPVSIHYGQAPVDEPLAIPYGCGVAPEGSLSVLSGAPATGATVTLGVDNPLGTQPAGAAAFLALALAPDPGFPCGTLVPGLGMAGPASPAELLVAPAAIFQVAPGPAWAGPGSPAAIPLAVPDDAALVGLALFVQGALVDDGSGLGVALTGAVELVIGA